MKKKFIYKLRTSISDLKSQLQCWQQEFLRGPARSKKKKRVLLYHVTGLSYGGTEKSLQFIAAHLDKNEFDVYFMYSERVDLFGNVKLEDIEKRRCNLLGKGVFLLRMDFDSMGPPPGMALKNANPSPGEVAKVLDIDLFITAGAGYGAYPIPTLKCPVILIDVFGYAQTLRRNVKYVLPISEAVRKKIDKVIPSKKLKTLHLPVPRPPENAEERGNEFRSRYCIPADSFVFGRIGRSDDSIFDPIAIKAFGKVNSEADQRRNSTFVIVGPCDLLKKYVSDHQLPNVVLIESLATDDEVWGFHSAIDVLAHSRIDGESLGINIIESLAAGNPIITHKSRHWNAHLDYLDEQCAFVSEVDAFEQYADFMIQISDPRNIDLARSMGQNARRKFEKLFSPERYIDCITQLIKDA